MKSFDLKKIAIVGANGFIGSALARYLQVRDIEIITFTSARPLTVDSHLSGDLSNSSHIIWCASRVNPATAAQNPGLVELELQEWTLFLDAFRELGDCKPTILFLSSGGCTYSSSELPFRETSKAKGINEYGKLKVAMEKKLFSLDIKSMIFRVSNAYGPDQPFGRGQGVIAEWLHAVQTGRSLDVYGSVESFRDYIYIDDLCEAIFSSLKLSDMGQIYNLGSGIPVSLEEVLNVICKYSSGKNNIRKFEGRATDRNGYYLDVQLLKSKTGWEPKFNLERGIAKILEQSNGL